MAPARHEASKTCFVFHLVWAARLFTEKPAGRLAQLSKWPPGNQLVPGNRVEGLLLGQWGLRCTPKPSCGLPRPWTNALSGLTRPLLLLHVERSAHVASSSSPRSASLGAPSQGCTELGMQLPGISTKPALREDLDMKRGEAGQTHQVRCLCFLAATRTHDVAVLWLPPAPGDAELVPADLSSAALSHGPTVLGSDPTHRSL